MDRRRAARPQWVFVVDRTELLTPHLVRVHLGGPAFDGFVAEATPERLTATDKYVKLLFASPELGLTPPYDLDELRSKLAPEDLPVRRTYTVRSIDRASGTIALDFVIHGDAGVAGPWAVTAQAGDLLSLSGPAGTYSPTSDAAVEHLIVGDDSAIPAIAAALENMPDAARGLGIIEVDSALDELALDRPAGIELRWLHRSSRDTRPDSEQPQSAGLLVEAVRQLSPRSGPVQVFAHGERSAMKEMRAILQDVWGIERQAMSLSAYWAFGRAEERFQAEKREAIGQIFMG